MESIDSYETFKQVIAKYPMCMIYFSNPTCNVCKVLKPKLSELLNSDFPKIKQFYCDSELVPEIAAQNCIFTNPTILFFFECKEAFRYGRLASLSQISIDINRAYSFLSHSYNPE